MTIKGLPELCRRLFLIADALVLLIFLEPNHDGTSSLLVYCPERTYRLLTLAAFYGGHRGI
jgi:hypothetical protein